MLEKVIIFFLIFVIYAFLGWVCEVINSLIREKKIINRGFMIGPYCPIYGVGIILISILLEKYHDDVIATYVFSILICGLLEYFTSYFMEKIFKVRWWDYSDRKCNINGRVCLENLLVFGLAGCYIVYISNPLIIKFLLKVPFPVLLVMSIIIASGMMVDFVISANIILNLKELDRNAKKDYTEEISKKVKKIIKSKLVLHRRMLREYPNIRKKINLDKIIEEIKKKIEHSQKHK